MRPVSYAERHRIAASKGSNEHRRVASRRLGWRRSAQSMIAVYVELWNQPVGGVVARLAGAVCFGRMVNRADASGSVSSKFQFSGAERHQASARGGFGPGDLRSWFVVNFYESPVRGQSKRAKARKSRPSGGRATAIPRGGAPFGCFTGSLCPKGFPLSAARVKGAAR